MHKRFLGVWQDDDGATYLQVFERATSALALNHGLTSPLICAAVDGNPADLGSAGVVVFLVPRSATVLLARLMNDEDPELAKQVFISHGHACVVLLLHSENGLGELLARLQEDILGYETWPHDGGRLIDERRQVQPPGIRDDWEALPDITEPGISFEAAAQLRQFNANLALFAQISERYAPEVEPLVLWLHQSITGVAGSLAELAASAGGDEQIRQAIAYESVLIEVNAVLTIYCSQVGSGTMPLIGSRFAVGEYSLLGIGAMCRAAWRIYSHLTETFAEFDHAGLMQRRYRTTASFDPFETTGASEYNGWATSTSGLAAIADGQTGGARYHVPYFSSRWGFHESLHSISLSWQCLHASATKEWNLLTLTHEFLHAHVRGLLGQLMDVDAEDVASLLQRYNAGQAGGNAFEAMQVAYVVALYRIRGTFRVSRKVTGEVHQTQSFGMPKRLTPDALQDLVRSHNLLLQEIAVHVLDFLYVYAGRDEEYINSIWSSWSLVPSVSDKIEHYVLRTICALAAATSKTSSSEVFEDAAQRLRQHLVPLLGRERLRPAIQAAIDVLEDPQTRRRLGTQFIGARYVVELTRNFMYDPTLHAELVRDENTTVIDDRRTYATDVGDFRGEAVASPIGFLLDRFRDYPDQAGAEKTEYESMWQMLLLI
jgi:hypothetical protein